MTLSLLDKDSGAGTDILILELLGAMVQFLPIVCLP
jgi:hypothetical protein